MTRTLILTRHAKSAWDDPGLDDHDRPLNRRGVRSATLLGKWINRAGWLPGEALVSSALRTCQTWEGIAAELPDPPKATVIETLYHAWPERLMTALRGASAPMVILIAHNPGIAAFASQITAVRPRHARFHDYPTGATTVIRFDREDWGEIDWGEGETLDFVIPRELAP